ncbi:RnfH family protein [Lysobacter sp. S4-A87]|uniref:RnfH family protein n=1 Tax=Lysobacter sp. S4-A87 TaxID=2925843 RepID=UPI001F538455|nr:RnfH family protein [Lysobacter sp. S4-A87]UNK50013.1 RnfH family protein [Lysobacter sp. S4-A87]
MKVEVVRAWPHRFEAIDLELPEGASVADALKAAGLDADAETTGYAVYGVRADPGTRLRDGDRLELLRPLQADPKESRRRRAQQAPRK